MCIRDRYNVASGLRSLNCARGSRNGLKIAPQSSRRVGSAPLLAQTPNPPAKRAGGRAGGA
eukprot:8741324-Alexandrium_andersonii.AAC.1